MLTLWERICTSENLLEAYRLARRGKLHKDDVQRYSRSLRDNLRLLQYEFHTGVWQPGKAKIFPIFEPKERLIVAAPFRDRVAHHAVIRVVEPILEKFQIFHSYACRKGKGTHACVWQAYRNQQRHAFFLRLDIHKFFPSVPHEILLNLLSQRVWDVQTMNFFRRVVHYGGSNGVGLPIGNLTSQLLANFYLAHLDHFILQHLHPAAYLRYMDDFVLWADDRASLREMLKKIHSYLEYVLQLQLNEQVTMLGTSRNGLTFLGFRILPFGIRLSLRSRHRLRGHIRRWEWGWHRGMDEKVLARRTDSVIGWCAFANSHVFLNSLLGGLR